MSCLAPWVVSDELDEDASYITSSICQFTFQLAHTGPVLMSPDGTIQRRLEVDDDGVPGVGLLSDNSIADDDVVFLSAGVGVIVCISSAVYARIAIDDDGALTTETVTLPGSWQLDYEYGTPATLDMLIPDVGAGIILVTPDSLHTYRVRVDTDGAIISEIVT